MNGKRKERRGGERRKGEQFVKNCSFSSNERKEEGTDRVLSVM